MNQNRVKDAGSGEGEGDERRISHNIRSIIKTLIIIANTKF